MKSRCWVVLLLTCVLLPLDAAEKKASLTLDPEKSFGNITYRDIGPTSQSGRFVDIAVPLQTPWTFYMATGSGGLWKTENNGITFTPIFDREAVFSIGAVAVAPSQPDHIWVGTGESNNSRSMYWGNGVYKSTDGGKTWKHLGLTDTHHIARIVIHPTDPNIVYVAAMGHLFSDNAERGLYKTADGGKTWTNVLPLQVKDRHVGITDVALDPRIPETVYAASYDRLRKPWTYQIGGIGSRIYKSVDGGKTWKKLENGLPGGIIGRIGLDVYRKNPAILYACVENANKPGMSEVDREAEILAGKASTGMIDGEVFRSEDHGETWRKVNQEKQNIGGAPGYYYGRIIIDPNDDQVVHVLSAASWGTRDGGKTWIRRPLRFGGDDHALWVDPVDSRHMIIGYDHGLGITYDGGKNWMRPDNLPLAQFYSVGFDYSRPYRVAGGMQDNGSVVGPSNRRDYGPIHFEDWYSVGSGDGMFNVFDYRTSRFLYSESQFGVISRIDLKTGERKSIGGQQKKPNLRFNWCAPIVVSPHDSDVIYHGANVLLRSSFRGESWDEISPDLTTADPSKLATGKGGDGNIQYCTITTVNESVLQNGLIWVGTDDGNIQLTRDGGKTWKKVNENIKDHPGYWVSRVIASRHAVGTAYVSLTGYRNDDFRPFLYKTTDFGETWISIAGNLPAEPVNVVREDPVNYRLLFVGTDLGIYVSFDGGKKWSSCRGDMPTQPVHDLQIHPREHDLIVATHGRGIFIADVSSWQEMTPENLRKDLHLCAIEPKILWTCPIRPESASANFPGKSEAREMMISYFLKTARKEDTIIRIFQGDKKISEFKGPATSGLHTIAWDMCEHRPRTEDEKKMYERRLRLTEEYGIRNIGSPDYVSIPLSAGTYRVELEAGSTVLTTDAVILADEWLENEG